MITYYGPNSHLVPLKDTFYVIYVEGNTSPTIAHRNLKEARKEFKRIKDGLTPNRRIWLLRTYEMKKA